MEKELALQTAEELSNIMITTVDNPYSPFDQFERWYQYDTEKGYDTLNYLARIARTSNEMSETDYALEVVRSIDEIIKHNPLPIYRKVYNNK